MTTLRFLLCRKGQLLDCKAELRDMHLDMPEGLVKSVLDVTRGEPEPFSPETSLYAHEVADLLCERADRLTRERLLKPLEALELAAEDWGATAKDRHTHHNAPHYRGPDYDGAPPPWR